VRLTAPPVEGTANKFLSRSLWDVPGAAEQDVERVTGHSGPQKLIDVPSLAPQDVYKRFQKHRLQL
jgi:uncharacterized protein YggU (UPF0235/DUF167 family)